MAIMRLSLATIAALFGMILTVPIILIGLPFWSIAVLTKFTNALFRRFKPKSIPWQQLTEFEPSVGWKAKANLNTHGEADGVFHLTTDAQGWRGRTKLAESEIVIFGDSFAFGYGADDQRFFAELNPQLRIKSIGINGYNMVQELLWMRRLSGQLKGKLVVWFIYFGNDLYENLQPNLDRYRMPFVRPVTGSQKWQIVTSHINPTRWPATSKREYIKRLAEICCSTSFLAERVYGACEFLIKEGQETCRGAGAKLLIMTIPETTQICESRRKRLRALAPDPGAFNPDLPDQRIGEICCKLGLPFVALKDHLDMAHHKELDCHWNDKGHKKVADLLDDLYSEHGIKKTGLESCNAPFSIQAST